MHGVPKNPKAGTLGPFILTVIFYPNVDNSLCYISLRELSSHKVKWLITNTTCIIIIKLQYQEFSCQINNKALYCFLPSIPHIHLEESKCSNNVLHVSDHDLGEERVRGRRHLRKWRQSSRRNLVTSFLDRKGISRVLD